MNDLILEAAKFLRDAEKHAMEKVMATVKQGNTWIQFGGVAFDRSTNIKPSFVWQLEIYLNGKKQVISKEVELADMVYEETQLENAVAESICNALYEAVRPYVISKIEKICHG